MTISKAVACIKMEIPVFVQSLKSPIMSLTSSQTDKIFRGVVSAAVRMLGTSGVHSCNLSPLSLHHLR